jgi:hypothetical protein
MTLTDGGPRWDRTEVDGERKIRRAGAREDSGQDRTEERNENRIVTDPSVEERIRRVNGTEEQDPPS